MRGLQTFDPTGANLQQLPNFEYNAGNGKEEAIVTFTVKRFGVPVGQAFPIPYQLFGALFGVHSAVDSNFKTIADSVIVGSSADYAKRKDAVLNSILGTLMSGLAGAADIAGVNQVASQTNALSTQYQSDFGLGAYPLNVVPNFPVDYKEVASVSWLDDGSLRIAAQEGSGSDMGVIISCQDIPYRSFLKALETSVVVINKMRMSYKNTSTLDRTLSVTSKSMFGFEDSNNIQPRSYFDPTQFQVGTTDIDQTVIIDGDTAINSIMDAEESEISYVMNVSRFVNNYIRN